jgi:hypothetical protein
LIRGTRIAGVANLALAVSIAAGCATSVPEDSDAWRNAQQQVLRQRAETRWNTLVKGDLEAAYEFLSPAQRSVVSLQQYKRSIGGAVQWRVAKVDDIRYDLPTVAAVSVAVTYRFVPPGSGGKEVESVRQMQEKWLYKDGVWWYTAQ